MRLFSLLLAALVLVAFGVVGADDVKLRDTDLVSIVLTVKTSKELLSSLSSRSLPTAATTDAVRRSLVRAIAGPFPPGPTEIDVTQ